MKVGPETQFWSHRHNPQPPPPEPLGLEGTHCSNSQGCRPLGGSGRPRRPGRSPSRGRFGSLPVACHSGGLTGLRMPLVRFSLTTGADVVSSLETATPVLPHLVRRPPVDGTSWLPRNTDQLKKTAGDSGTSLCSTTLCMRRAPGVRIEPKPLNFALDALVLLVHVAC